MTGIDQELDVTDLFCGAGGSGLGARAAGFTLKMAANHWQQAIDTHSANFPDTEHDCADISQVEPRRYRRTRVLWASPECTNHSQAKGKARSLQSQPDLFGDALPDAAAERSRATMWDVPRFAEVHRYDAIVVENVVEAARWVQFPAWLMAMDLLGYHHQLVYLNSMHAQSIDAPRAPQSRDRLYIVLHRKGARKPDVQLRPLAWCASCQAEVRAVQSWKKPDRPWGRYRAQYVYRCPNHACRRSVVEPYALPAASAIDWKWPGQRIGDRAKPLSPKTIARIEAGLRKYARPLTFEAHGNTFVRTGPDGRPVYARAWPVDQPTATLTTTETRALITPPQGAFLTQFRERVRDLDPTREPFPTVVSDGANHALIVPVEGRDNVNARPAAEPMRTATARLQDALVVPAGGTWRDTATSAAAPFGTVTTRETDALVVPYYGTAVAHPAEDPLPTMGTIDTAGVAFVAELRGGGSDARPVTDPLSTVTASGNHHMLVRNNGDGSPSAGLMCTSASEPMRTVVAITNQSLVSIEQMVADCTFRMLEPHEIQAAMAFHPGYQVLGNRREKVRQLGNGVTPPAAEFLLRAVAESLEPAPC